jgi:glycosyltransferase involved in cell wall biosynthesis
MGVLAYFMRLGKLKLIYSPHELESHRAGISYWHRKLINLSEKLAIRFYAKIIVVCSPIGDWYEKRYPLKYVYVLRSIPVRRKIQIQTNFNLKRKFRISSDEILFIYQGVIDEYRGINFLLKVFEKLKESNCHIVFMGFGNLVEKVKKVSAESKNIHFKDAVPSKDILSFTSSADVGLEINTIDYGLSYRYTFANKFFEYSLAGIPIITSDIYSYMSDIVKNKEIGWVINDDLEETVTMLKGLSSEDFSVKKLNIIKYAKNFNWEEEKQILRKIYV